MKYTISINQFAIQEAGFDFDLTDAAIFEVLKDYCNSTACRKMQEDGRPFFNVPYRIIIDELPLAKINKPDSVYRRFQKLEQHGIIEMHPDNKKMKQVWFAWGYNYDRMLFRSQTGSKSDQPDLNPYQTGLESVLRPDLNPPHPNTISFNYPIDIGRAPENSADVEAKPLPQNVGGAAARRANSSDEAENLIREWANGEGRATVKNWIAETTFSEKVHGKVRDEITKFVGHYAVSDKPGVSHKMFSDPVTFFKNRFKAWLVQAKELNRPAANGKPALEYQPSKYLSQP